MTAAVHYKTGGFPPEERLDWPKLIPFLGPAYAAVARYDGMLAAIPNRNVLLGPLTTREAVLSSRIEGTQATLSDVLGFEAGLEPESASRRLDVQEVLNYRTALRRAVEMLQTLPLSQRVIRQSHRILLDGVRGTGKAPGDYRRIPNWIGPPGCSIDEATFVPIGAEALPDAMSAWERYLHQDAPDRLVQLAILHAEFEALHPFLDGNGRLGRMLVPLFLWQQRLIRAPTFYISAWLESHRDAYYDGLLAVSRDDDWAGWCRFFLQAVQEQAEENLVKAQDILNLYESLKRRILGLTRSSLGIYALDWIFDRPIFRGTEFVEQLAIPPSSARRILKLLRDEGVLRSVVGGRGRQSAVLAFPELLNIAEGGDVF